MNRPDNHNEASIDTVFSQLPVAVAWLDDQFRFVATNSVFDRMHGIDGGVEVGSDLDVLPVTLADLYRARCRSVQKSGEPLLRQSEMVRSPSHGMARRDWLISVVALSQPEATFARDTDNATGLALTVEDVTRHRDQERQLIAERRVALVLARAQHLDDALPAALDGILRSFDLDYCEYWMPDEQQNLHRQILCTGNGRSQDFVAVPLAFGEGLIGEVYQSGQPVCIADVSQDSRFRRVEAAQKLGLRTGFAFPVTLDDTCIGVISLFSTDRLDVGESLAKVLTRLGEEIGLFAQRAEIQSLARENEARTNLVIESALDAVITMDDAGRVLRWNPRAVEMFGHTAERAIGSDLADLIVPEPLREAHSKGLARFLETGEGPVLNKRIEISAIRADGSEFPVELAVLPLRLGDRFEFSAYVRDITERKQTEAQLREADRRKSEFLAVLGHELRNPLATIANCVRLIDEPNSAVSELAAMMRPQVAQLRNLLDDLLDVTRINHGKIALNRRVLRVGDVVDGAVMATEAQRQENQQQLAVDIDEVANQKIYADDTRIQQVLGNLLTNASKYSSEGAQIRLEGARSRGRVELAVEDNGIGIPAERLDDIFEAFMQVRESARDAGGLGIGLTLVKQLTELHGGTITVTSGGNGKGSRFVVSLPDSIPDNAALKEVQTRNRSTGLNSGLHVLIIDDNESAATSMARLLELVGGCRTTVAFDGSGGLAAAEADLPDAMVVDIKLPDMSGLDIAKKIRSNSRFTGTRLVAVSGFGHQEAIAESLQAGFEHHLAKPIEVDELLACLQPVQVRRI